MIRASAITVTSALVLPCNHYCPLKSLFASIVKGVLCAPSHGSSPYPIALPLWGSRLWVRIRRVGRGTYYALSIIPVGVDRRIPCQPKANLSRGVSDRFGHHGGCIMRACIFIIVYRPFGRNRVPFV